MIHSTRIPAIRLSQASTFGMASKQLIGRGDARDTHSVG
jgi:hypothetical protein